MKNWFRHYGILAFLAVIVILVSIKTYKYFSKQQVTIGFYHWKKELSLVDEEEKAILEDKNTPVYLRCFDVDWDEERAFIIPRSSLKISKSLPENTPVTPVVFLSNHIFEAVPDSQMTLIAETISNE